VRGEGGGGKGCREMERYGDRCGGSRDGGGSRRGGGCRREEEAVGRGEGWLGRWGGVTGTNIRSMGKSGGLGGGEVGEGDGRGVGEGKEGVAGGEGRVRGGREWRREMMQADGGGVSRVWARRGWGGREDSRR